MTSNKNDWLKVLKYFTIFKKKLQLNILKICLHKKKKCKSPALDFTSSLYKVSRRISNRTYWNSAGQQTANFKKKKGISIDTLTQYFQRMRDLPRLHGSYLADVVPGVLRPNILQFQTVTAPGESRNSAEILRSGRRR